MNSAEFLLFYKCLTILTALLYTLILTAFAAPFLPKDAHRKRKTMLLFTALLTSHLLCSILPVPRGSLSLILLILLLTSAHAISLERPLAVLLLLFYINTKIAGSLLTESLQFIFKKLLPSNHTAPEAIYLHTALGTTGLLLSHAVILAVLLYALQRRMRKKHITLHRRELCYVSLIPLAGILFGQMISHLLLEIKDGTPLLLYERHPAFLIVVPLLSMLFYAGSYLTITFQQGMSTLQEEKETFFVEQQQTQALRKQIHETEQFYDHIRQMKHEMKNHLTNIQALARNGSCADIEKYIGRMDESMDSFELTFQTGNPVTDVIVSDKGRQCSKQDIDFLVDFHYPVSGQYDAFDLGIILHNLLQNALEACEKGAGDRQYITLNGKQKGRFFLIEVTNTFTGEVTFGENGLPVTTKTEDIPMHGIGLPNVRREAEKYMGGLELKTEKQVFYATILLQERSNT